MFTDCFNRIFDCSIRVSRSFANQVVGHSKHLIGAGPCQACLLATPLLETTVSRVLLVSAILVSDYSCFIACAQPIILELFLPKLWPIIFKIIPAY